MALINSGNFGIVIFGKSVHEKKSYIKLTVFCKELFKTVLFGLLISFRRLC